MKIAIPLTDTDEFSPHYGGSSKFAVVEVDPRHRTVRRRMIVVPPESEPCSWPLLLRAAGVNLVLTGGMGRGAQVRMAELGIKVLAPLRWLVQIRCGRGRPAAPRYAPADDCCPS